MSISDGTPVNAANVNAQLASKTADNTLAGKQNLQNADAASGANVDNAQKEINGVGNFVGRASGGTHDSDPTWSSDSIGTANESVKDRVDSVQAVVESNQSNKIDKIVSTDNSIPRHDGIAGTHQDSSVLIDDSNNITGVNDLTVTGDLTVNGTTTTIDTATLDVTDANITVNSGGNQATADDTAGLTVEMSDATDAKVIYDKDATSKFKVGESGSEVEVATISGSQVITNKDIDGGTASNTNRITLPKETTTNLDLLTNKEGTIAYDTTLAKPVYNSGSAWQELGGGGSGSGEGIKNYITNSNAENDGAETTSTATAVSDSDITITSTAIAPITIAGALSFDMQIANTANTSDYGEWSMGDIDNYDIGEKVFISFKYYTDGNYSTDDVQFVLRNVDSAVDVPIQNDNDGKLVASTSFKKFQGVAFLNDSDNTYTLRANVLSAPSTASHIYIDDIVVTPSDSIPTATITDWESYTPTFANLGTVTVNYAKWRRVGENIEVIGNIDTGTVTSGSATISLPTGLSIEVVDRVGVGHWHQGGLSTADFTRGSFQANDSSTTLTFVDDYSTAASSGQVFSSPSATVIFRNSTEVSFNFSVPIQGWTSGNVISSTQTDLETVKVIYQVDSSTTNTAFAHNTWERVDVNFKVLDTHNTVTVDTGSSPNSPNNDWVFTAPRKGLYEIEYTLGWQLSTNLTRSSVRWTKAGSASESKTLMNNEAVVQSPGTVSGKVWLEKDDTLYIEARQNDSGLGSRNISFGNTNTVRIVSYPDFTTFGVYNNFDYVSGESSAYNPTTSSRWFPLTGNDLDLEMGTYLLLPSQCAFYGSGGAAAFGRFITVWSSDTPVSETSTAPTGLDSASEITVLSSGVSALTKDGFSEVYPVNSGEGSVYTGAVLIQVHSPVTIYQNAFAIVNAGLSGGTATARVAVAPTAMRVK